MIVGPPPQSVTKVSPALLFFSHFESVESILRLVQGHVTQSVQSQSSVFAQLTVHADELVQASEHCILTVRGTLVSAGTSLNAISSMLRVLAL